MKKEKLVVDERIQQITNKYLAQAGSMAVGIAIISMFVKCVILEMPFTSYMMEIIIFFIPSLYYLIRIIASGIMPFAVKDDQIEKRSRKKAIILGSTFFGVFSACFMTYQQYGWAFTPIAIVKFLLILIFASVFFGVGMYQLENWMNRIAAKKMDKALENQEEEEL